MASRRFVYSMIPPSALLLLTLAAIVGTAAERYQVASAIGDPSPMSTELVDTGREVEGVVGVRTAQVVGEVGLLDEQEGRHDSDFRGGNDDNTAGYYVRGSESSGIPDRRQKGEHNWPLADAYEGGHSSAATADPLSPGRQTRVGNYYADNPEGRAAAGSNDFHSSVTETDMDVDLDIELPALLLLNDREATEDLLGGIQIQLKDLINTLSNTVSGSSATEEASNQALSSANNRVGRAAGAALHPSAPPGRDDTYTPSEAGDAVVGTERHDSTTSDETSRLKGATVSRAQHGSESIIRQPDSASSPAAGASVGGSDQNIHIRESLHSHNKRIDTNGNAAAVSPSPVSSSPPIALVSSSLEVGENSGSPVRLLDATQNWATDFAERTTDAAERLPRWALPTVLLLLMLTIGAVSLCCCGCFDVNHLADMHDPPAAEPEPEVVLKPGELRTKLEHYAAHPEESPTINSPRAVALERMKANLRKSRPPSGMTRKQPQVPAQV